MTSDPVVVALVPAFNSAAVLSTVQALVDADVADRIVVLDDGSTELPPPVEELVAAGATVARVPSNRGKSGAIAAGVDLLDDADIVLLADADLGQTAAELRPLVDVVARGDADMSVAVFPPAAGRGGFGLVKGWSRRAVRRLGRLEVDEPLSGQRAIDAAWLRSVHPAPRFGFEVGLGIDLGAAGARVVEIPLPLDHAHTGRSVSGFRHRGRQALDIARTVAPRLGSPWARRGALLAITMALSLLVALFPPGRAVVGDAVFSRSERSVVLVTVTGLRYSDLATGRLPELSRLLERSAGALANRTPSSPSDLPTTFATLGAGASVIMRSPATAAEGNPSENEGLQGAAPVDPLAPDVSVEQQADGSGRVRTSDVPTDDRRSIGTLGQLGDSLDAAGVRSVYVRARSGPAGSPGALAVANSRGVIGGVDLGSLPDGPGPDVAPLVADRVRAVRAATATRSVVLVDAGGMPVPRPPGSLPLTDAEADERERTRLDELAVADSLIGALTSELPGVSILVFGVAPPGRWRLAPITAVGGTNGSLSSPSTRREGEVVVTDIAPTVLASLGVDVPSAMVGASMTAGPGPASPASLSDLNDRTDARERAYVPMIWAFVGLQALIYLGSMFALRRRRETHDSRFVRAGVPVVLGSAAFPAVTFVYR
ncbi:MAG: glycosyltransferase, partial [Actinomycetes bacterium]